MEYRGKQYSVILSIGGKWKWSVEIDGHTKSGSAPNRLAGIKVAKAEIDRALARKKKRPVPPAPLISAYPRHSDYVLCGVFFAPEVRYPTDTGLRVGKNLQKRGGGRMYPFATAVGPRRDPGPYFLFRDDELASPVADAVQWSVPIVIGVLSVFEPSCPDFVVVVS
ncbi:hypothetical protein IVA95_01710 [Bradyrhizobium sp. 157]|uniref:hypothetical protein n=1 Tax=Bradyrhizobium sp. 157 TaxID=2782631 RepID=UPI001FFB9E9F|nr:hypothetical protein [Bradyrhizobium sp. 157]MCK1636333.1 hypothetical protein [Bradyrhizobium sp. 157]